MALKSVCRALALGISVAASTVQAQDSDILIGASLPLTGPNAGAGQEGLAVMRAYFEQVNASGGIGGRKIALDARDDAFDAQKSAENARAIAKSRKSSVALVKYAV